MAALAFIKHHFPEISVELASPSLKTRIGWQNLWAIFSPNLLMFAKDILDEPRVWRCVDTRYQKKWDGTRQFIIRAESAEYDGRQIGFAFTDLVIPLYQDVKLMEELQYQPLYLLPGRQTIWKDVLARTQIQLSFIDLPYKVQEHGGEGIVPGPPKQSYYDPDPPPRRCHVSVLRLWCTH